MKSIFRFGILAAIAVAMAVTPALTTRAQGSYCPTGLSADDCKLLTDSAAGQASVKTFVVDYTLSLKTTGTPSDVSLNVTGNGPIDISKIDTTAAATDPTSAIKNLVMQNTINADITNASQPEQKVAIEVRIVNGIVYFKADPGTQGKWGMSDLSKSMGNMAGASAMNPAAMAKTFDPATIAALTGLLGSSISGTSAAGPTVDGVATTQITINLDAAALVQSLGTPAAAAAIKSIAASQGATMTDAQITQAQAQITQFATLLNTTLKATKISLDWLIDPAKKQYRGFDLKFSTTIDAQTAAMFGGGAAAGTPITVDFSLGLKLSSLNAPVTVAPVPDAVDTTSLSSSSSSSAAATAAATTAQ